MIGRTNAVITVVAENTANDAGSADSGDDE